MLKDRTSRWFPTRLYPVATDLQENPEYLPAVWPLFSILIGCSMMSFHDFRWNKIQVISEFNTISQLTSIQSLYIIKQYPKTFLLSSIYFATHIGSDDVLLFFCGNKSVKPYTNLIGLQNYLDLHICNSYPLFFF